MSVIQKIRDKYARWAVIAIAVSLLGFIMMDAFAGKTGLFSNRPSNTIGKVNGKSIDRVAFEQKIQNEEKTEQQQGYPVDDNRRQQIVQGLWDEQVTNLIMNDEYEKLGLTVTDKEMREVLYGANPPQFLGQAFTDSSGRYNGIAAQQQVNKLLKSGTQEQKDYINQQMQNLPKMINCVCTGLPPYHDISNKEFLAFRICQGLNRSPIIKYIN